MKKVVFIVVGAVIVVAAGFFIWWKYFFAPEAVFCIQDAKLCPDGSYVGRVAPQCDFARCPPGDSR